MVKGIIAAGSVMLLATCVSCLLVVSDRHQRWKMLACGTLLFSVWVTMAFLLDALVENSDCLAAKEWILNLVFLCFYFLVLVTCCIFVGVRV